MPVRASDHDHEYDNVDEYLDDHDDKSDYYHNGAYHHHIIVRARNLNDLFDLDVDD